MEDLYLDLLDDACEIPTNDQKMVEKCIQEVHEVLAHLPGDRVVFQTPGPAVASRNPLIQFPMATIPIFDCGYEKWRSFRNLFKKIVIE